MLAWAQPLPGIGADVLGPGLAELAATHPVIGEVRGGLEGWTKSERWAKLGISEQLQDTAFRWRY